jgi:hypothetical protein
MRRVCALSFVAAREVKQENMMTRSALLCLLALPMAAAFTAPMTGFNAGALRAGKSPVAASPLGRPLSAASLGLRSGEQTLCQSTPAPP